MAILILLRSFVSLAKGALFAPSPWVVGDRESVTFQASLLCFVNFSPALVILAYSLVLYLNELSHVILVSC